MKTTFYIFSPKKNRLIVLIVFSVWTEGILYSEISVSYKNFRRQFERWPLSTHSDITKSNTLSFVIWFSLQIEKHNVIFFSVVRVGDLEDTRSEPSQTNIPINYFWKSFRNVENISVKKIIPEMFLLLVVQTDGPPSVIIVLYGCLVQEAPLDISL